MKNRIKNKPKVVVIVGPTASGKSTLAIKLAKKFNGEVISADSRQVYRGLNIGTGKITKREMQGIPHHLLDVANPRQQWSVWRYIVISRKKIKDTIARGKLPIICGGTGFYIDVLLGNMSIADVPANRALRKKLASKSADELYRLLKKLDPARAKAIDRYNKVRLIRSIEIAKALGAMPSPKQEAPYDVLKIGIVLPNKVLRKNITVRLFARISRGMVAEARRLHRRGLSWKRMEELGLEYRYLARYLQNKTLKEDLDDISLKNRRYIAYNTMLKELETAIWHYAKRQMTWFKRDKKIRWFHSTKTPEIDETVKRFLK